MSVENPTNIHAFVARGKNSGSLLYPHRYPDGRFVVSPTKSEQDYVFVDDYSQLLDWLERGFGLRMSNPACGITSPSFIKPENIFRPVIF